MPATFFQHVLPNGLRVVCETMPRVRSAAVSFCVRTGSRHETADLHGVSHFLEHMCFKGSRGGRTWRELNVRFDELGSIYNAYTSKEHTVFYGWLPADRLDAQVELLADLVRPRLPADEFELERKVILEEIAMNEDEFEHRVADFLHEVVFGTHPLAHEILGDKATIAHLPRDVMEAYWTRHYAPDNMFALVAGAVEPEVALASIGRYCGAWQRNGQRPRPAPPAGHFAGTHKLVLDRFQQQSVMLVYPSVGNGHPAEESLEAFTGLFGGHNSRCFWNIVQKGVCAQAGAAWLSYQDCGVLALYADGPPENAERMIAALREQAQAVTEGGFKPDEVQRVKNQRRTQLALEAENPRTRMMQLLDDLESYDYPRTPAARLAAVEAVTADSIADYLSEYPITGEGLLLSAGPRDWP
jgi:predicted Zn-dependent peptidase